MSYYQGFELRYDYTTGTWGIYDCGDLVEDMFVEKEDAEEYIDELINLREE